MNWRAIGTVLAKVARAQARRTAEPSARSGPASTGRSLQYSPNLDGDADPGEIVWAWVPFEEDASRGKDRPLLVVGRDGDEICGLMLSSNSDRDGERHWLSLGAGTWDGQHRPSWVRLDRVLKVAENGIRREGAVLDRPRFELVADRLRRSYGWQ